MYPVVGITQVEGEKPAVSLAVPAAFFHHGVDGVSYDIVDCLLQVYGICQGDDRVIRKVAADFYMAGLLFKGLQDAFQQFFQINIYQMQLVGFRTFMDFINPAVKLFAAVYGFLDGLFGTLHGGKQFQLRLYGKKFVFYVMAEYLGGGFRGVNLFGYFKGFHINLMADVGEPVKAVAYQQQENNEHKRKYIVEYYIAAQIYIPEIIGIRKLGNAQQERRRS